MTALYIDVSHEGPTRNLGRPGLA